MKKYRPSKRVNYLLKKMKKGMIFLCGKNKDLEILRVKLGDGSLVFTGLSDDVLRKLINLTIDIYNPQKTHTFPAVGT
ncbi:hypothetical protein N9B82_03025 [Saprospiraceae bacterium]|nr:hypothetical protein [Saprospiraceae bacterium]